MFIKQRKLTFITVLFLLCYTFTNICALESIEQLHFDHLYPETPVSRVLRAMKQLHATMTSIKKQEITSIDCALARIVEIQSLTICGTLQELDRAIQKGFQITRDHAVLICRVWKSLEILARDENVKRYLCRNIV